MQHKQGTVQVATKRPFSLSLTQTSQRDFVVAASVVKRGAGGDGHFQIRGKDLFQKGENNSVSRDVRDMGQCHWPKKAHK